MAPFLLKGDFMRDQTLNTKTDRLIGEQPKPPSGSPSPCSAAGKNLPTGVDKSRQSFAKYSVRALPVCSEAASDFRGRSETTRGLPTLDPRVRHGIFGANREIYCLKNPKLHLPRSTSGDESGHRSRKAEDCQS